MESLIRARTLDGFADCVSALGGNPQTIFSALGIKTRQLTDTSAWLPFARVLAAYEMASHMLDDSAFGIKLVRFRDFSYLGRMSDAARHADDVRGALSDVARFMTIQNTGFELSLVSTPAGGEFRMGVPPDLRHVCNQWIEESAATAIRFCTEIADGEFQPERVLMRHRQLNPLSVYREAFGCDVKFEQESDSILISNQSLDAPTKARDQNIHDDLSLLLAGRAAESESLVMSLRGIVRDLIPLNRANLETVANELGLHERTLQRRISKMGISFSDILDDERRRLAEKLLAENDIPKSNIAYYLGYADQSSFNHAFRRWNRQSPSDWVSQN